MDNYCDEWNYVIYLSESTINKTNLIAAIQESVLTAQEKNTLNNMFVVTEGVAEKVKGAIAKIIAALTRIWGRFIEAMSALIKRDKNYLIKYKDIILKKTFLQNYTFTMYNYQVGQPDLLGTYAPAFNFSSLEKDLESEEIFVTKYFKKVEAIQKKNGDINFEEAVKILFRGSDSELAIESSKFNMTDAYNFCVNYEAIAKKFDTDKKNIKVAADDVQKRIEQMSREAKTQEPVAPVPTGATKESFDFFAYGSYKSYLYENTVINEVDIKAPEQATVNQTPSQAGVSNTSDPNKAVINQQGTANKEVDQTQIDNAGGSDKSVDKIKIYIKVVGELMTAKCQVCEEMYKAYMQIIRSHVKDHVGKSDTSTTKPEDKATVQGTDNSKIDTSGL